MSALLWRHFLAAFSPYNIVVCSNKMHGRKHCLHRPRDAATWEPYRSFLSNGLNRSDSLLKSLRQIWCKTGFKTTELSQNAFEIVPVPGFCKFCMWATDENMSHCETWETGRPLSFLDLRFLWSICNNGVNTSALEDLDSLLRHVPVIYCKQKDVDVFR